MSNAIRIAIAVFFILHGLAHGVGVANNWEIDLGDENEMAYQETIFDGEIDLGQTGTRVYGALWLLALFGFLVAAFGLATNKKWWFSATAAVTFLSLILSVARFDDAITGVYLNLAILIGLGLVVFLNQRGAGRARPTAPA
jgi:hypothetical protein